MVITNTPVKIDKVVGLQIGQVGESATSQIKFDVSAWLEKYPDISVSVRFKRPGEESVLACASSLGDDVLTWTVSSWETQIAGVGYAEVRAIDEDGRLAKSKVIPCSIEVCIDGTDESYIPVAVKAYFDDEFERIDTEISSDVDQRISAETAARANSDLELSEEIAVERERITNLATLDEGSTTGDAELIDIRVGADGTTYDNAGTAVRSQVADLKSAIGDKVQIIEGSYISQIWTDQNYSCFVKVTPGSTYTFGREASASSSPYVGLKTVTLPPTVGDAAVLSDADGWNETRSVANHTTETGIIPADVNWLWFYAGTNTDYTRLPTTIIINGINILNSTIVDDVNVIAFSSVPKDISYLGYTKLTDCHEKGVYRTGATYVSSITDMPSDYDNGAFTLYVENPVFVNDTFATQRIVSIDGSAWERVIRKGASGVWTPYSVYDWKRVFDSSFTPANQTDLAQLTAEVNALVSKTIVEKPYATEFVSGGLSGSSNPTVDTTRIRTYGISMPRMKTDDIVVIDEPYEGRVYASVQPGYGKYVYDIITGNDWVTGPVGITEEYNGKYIGVLIRKIGHESDDISSEVETIGNYVKFNYIEAVAQNTEKDIFSGLNVSVLGDSISAIRNYIPVGNAYYYNGSNRGITNVNQMWWKVLTDSTGASPLIINAWSGSGITQLEDSGHANITPMSADNRCCALHAYVHANDDDDDAVEVTAENIDSIVTSPFFPAYTPAVGDYVKKVEPDIVVIAGGVNDYTYALSAQSEALPWNGKTTPVLDNSFTEAYACMIKKIQEAYPFAIVVALSTWFTMRGNDNGYTLTHMVGDNVYTQTDYNDAIRNVAEQMHIPYIDVSNIGFNRNNFYPTYAPDSETIPTHPNAAGHYVMGRAITRKIVPLVKAFKET